MRRFLPAVLAGCLALCAASCGDGGRTARASIVVEKGSDGIFRAEGQPKAYTGEVVLYGNAGRRTAEERYNQGRPDGVWRSWWSNGQLKYETTWKEGAMTFSRIWHENGAKREETAYENGAPIGLWMIWYPDGRIKRQMFLEPGSKRHGQVLEYAEDGSVIWDALYEHGVYISGKVPPPSAAPTAK